MFVKQNDAVLGEGEIGVTQFNICTGRLFYIILHPVVHSVFKELGEHKLVKNRPALAIEDHNFGQV